MSLVLPVVRREITHVIVNSYYRIL